MDLRGLIRRSTSALRRICVIVLAVLVTACSGVGKGPTRQLVEQAIALQLSQTQQMLGKQLKLSPVDSTIAVQHVTVTAQTPLVIDSLPAFRIQGTYDFRVKLPTHEVSEHQNPFEVYLQRQAEGKTWRTARLETDEAGAPVWITQRLPY
jgi:hypothetical protein